MKEGRIFKGKPPQKIYWSEGSAPNRFEDLWYKLFLSSQNEWKKVVSFDFGYSGEYIAGVLNADVLHISEFAYFNPPNSMSTSTAQTIIAEETADARIKKLVKARLMHNDAPHATTQSARDAWVEKQLQTEEGKKFLDELADKIIARNEKGECDCSC